ncbi:NACHT, LRR and PYD domains-containing protein 3-like [Misgurnus anguillicaudatus]|uniref:NACHT, LRR and PYD domains-containing protein 3-like n=1 Tax=Misgurnus anguillicaudatus TaxID=75329 RepID=UPI003CCF382C
MRRELSYCNITDEGCDALTSALTSNPSYLTELILTGNKIGDSGVKLISDVLKNPDCKLKILELLGCKITAEGCVALSSGLRSNPSHLRELDLSYNDVRDLGVKLICCAALSSALTSNPSHLRDLKLNWNNLRDTDARLISDALKNPDSLRSNPSHLRHLNLSLNFLGDLGVKLISAILENPQCKLQKLCLVYQKRSDPEPSCVSMKSEASMVQPLNINSGDNQPDLNSVIRRDDPEPSCVSIKSDASMVQPLYLNSGDKQPDLKSIHSAGAIITEPDRPESPPQDFSDKIDPGFSHESEVLNTFRSNIRKRCQCLFEGTPKQRNPTSLNEIYTELNITQSESGEISNEHEVRQIETQSRRRTTEETPIKYNDIFNPLPEQHKHIRSVLTKGVAGIGKTVSVQKFILDWAEEKENQDVHLIFPLPFREINLMKDKTLSLLDLLHLFFPETKEMEIFSDEYKVLFIFDGLDECRLSLDFHSSVRLCDVNESTSVDVMLTNLIKGNLFPSARIWITSRPAAADLIPSECVDRVTEVRGFSDPQKEEYFRKRIRHKSLAKKIISHLKASRSLYIMCHIPVFCWISGTVLERILSEAKSQEIPKTLTQMYTHFLILQTNIKNQKTIKNYKKIKDMIFKLGKLAFEQLVKGNVIFYDEDLRECDIDVSEASVYSGLCTQIFREEFGLYQGKVYSFVHLSIQEHLAAPINLDKERRVNIIYSASESC